MPSRLLVEHVSKWSQLVVRYSSTTYEKYFTVEATEEICTIGEDCPEFKRNIYSRSIPFKYLCTQQATPMSAIGWLITSVVELFLYAMVLWKARQRRKLSAEIALGLSSRLGLRVQDVTTIMAKHSRAYFAV